MLPGCAQDKAEAKVKAMEARAEEQRKAKAAADAEWRKQQRVRELQRADVSTSGSGACLPALPCVSLLKGSSGYVTLLAPESAFSSLT